MKRGYYGTEVNYGKTSQTQEDVRVCLSDEYKAEALKLAEKVDVGPAAERLGVHESQLYTWRNKVKQKESSSDPEQQLRVENARLKRHLAEREEELTVLKRPRRTLRRTRSEVRPYGRTY